MLKNSAPRAVLPAVIVAVTLGLAPLPAAHAAVGEMLGRLPAGEISCDQAAAHWTSDADYQARVAQAQALASIDPRGGQIVAALGRVDAAAERCGLKGTINTGGDGGSADAGTSGDSSAGGAAGTAPGAGTDDAGQNQGAATDSGGSPDAAGSDAPGGAAGSGKQRTPAPGGGGTPEAPVTDAEAVLGPIRNNPTTPTKTIEVLGQGQVEVADAQAMMSNFLRQFTIIT